VPTEPILRIRLLGELDLRHGDARVPPMESARAESLLGYLLLLLLLLLLRRGRASARP
jgi:hypothetical protein